MTTKKEITKTEEEIVINNEILTYNEKDFKNEEKKLYLIDPKDVKVPAIPVKISIQEAKDLAIWSKIDIPLLIRIGIDEEIILSILLRAELLQWCEANWLNNRFNKKDVHQQWLIESEEGYELQQILFHDFTFAYRKNPDVLRKLKIVKNGRSHADLFQDLSDMAMIGQANSEELNAMDFDMKLLDKAEEKAKTLGTLLAMSRAEDTNHGAKELRDRAYTYLKSAVDEVRAGGQHLFWHNEEKLRGYKSKYASRYNNSRKDKSNDSEDVTAS